MTNASDSVVFELARECQPILERVARREGWIYYGDLSREIGPKVGIPDLNPRDPRLISALERLSRQTYHTSGIMLSVLVVNADRGMPGGGFFTLAQTLGAYPKDISKEDVFRNEIKKVHNHYRRRRRSINAG